MRRLFIVYAAVPLFFFAIGMQCQEVPLREAIPRIETYLASEKAMQSFRGSVLVGINGKIVFEKGYGFADQEWNARNTPTTKFRIASLTKQFTAACILLLQERNQLSVQDRASKYVTGLPEAWQAITIHELLTHTSGIPNYPSFPQIEKLNRTGATPWELLAVAASKPLEFKPGAKLTYSNTGYVLLGMVIEKISGQSYAVFLQENIFKPLGMLKSGYDNAATVLGERASGYQIKHGHVSNADFIDMSIPFAAGGIYSTVGDLYRWNEALAIPGRLLTKQSLQQMFGVYPETTSYGGQNYGYGVVITQRFDRLLYYHGGGVQGFSSSLQRYPKEHVCIIVLANIDPFKPWNTGDQIAAFLFGQPLPPVR